MIRVLIADDEPLARDVLRIRLADEPGVEVVGEAANGAEAVARTESLLPDVLLLDISMPDMTGFEVLRRLQLPEPPVVVLVTAYDHHAIQAFEANAVDYLLKPFSRARLRQMLARVQERVAARDARTEQQRLRGFLRTLESPDDAAPVPDPGAPDSQGRWLSVRDGDRYLLLEAAQIRWLEASGNYVRVHHRDGIHRVRGTLAALEARLSQSDFVRVHRAAIVNRRYVREIRPTWHGDYTIILADGVSVRLSRTHRSRLLGR